MPSRKKGAPSPHRIATVANIKGGSTKSTTTIHLADALTQAGRKVLLVDMDPQASLTEFFLPDTDPDDLAGNCLSLILGEATLEDAIRDCGWVSLVPSVIELSRLSMYVVGKLKLLKSLANALDATDYDTILIDTPGAVCAELTAALIASGTLLVPVTPSRWTARALRLLWGEVANAQELGAEVDSFVIPTMFGNSKADQAVLEAIGKSAVTHLPAIPKNTAVQNRTEAGQRLQPGTVAADAFQALANRLLEVWKHEPVSR